MLVARKYDLPIYEEYLKSERHQGNNTQKKNKKRIARHSSSEVARAMFTIAIFFALGFFIVFRHVNLAEMSNTIDMQKKHISELQKVNSQLKTETVIDLNKVDEVAKNKLGMDKPYKYQMVYVNINDNTQLVEKDNNKIHEYKIAQAISKVIQYLY